MENCNGLVVASEASQATDRAERKAAIKMAQTLQGVAFKNLGADKIYAIRDFVANLRISGITPHVV